jgi:hypothetical protein
VAGSEAEEFRCWINKEFYGWYRKNFKLAGLCDGRARRADGELLVVLDFPGPANAILDRMAAEFPELQFSYGHVREVVGRRFDASNGRIEYEFTDQNGDSWHGPDGRYEMYPYETEDDEPFDPSTPQDAEAVG